MTPRLVVFVTLTSVLAACRIASPPDPNAGLGPRATVYSPVVNEQIGELFAEGDGTWAFRTPDEARAKSYELGRVVAFGDVDERLRHLFVVVGIGSWGVRLQRLDADPVEGRGEGALIPITQLDRQAGTRWGFCAGEGDVVANECLDQGEPGTRWWIYELSDDGRVQTTGKDSSKSASLPVALRGQVSVGPLGRDVVGFDLPRHWLAIPGATPGPRPTRPRIAVDPGCQVGSPHREAFDAQWVTAKIHPPTNALQTSSEAVRLGADTLVWCDGQQVRIAIPTLYRPGVEVLGRDFDLPPMLGSRILTLPHAAAAATDWVARLGAAIATGDFATADYLAEATAREFGDQRPIDDVLVESMTAIAAGGRPELAAHMGRWATRLQWNPENSPAWQLGMASVEAILGNRKAAITRTADLPDVLERQGDAVQRGWVAYFWTLSELRARKAARDLLQPLDSHPELALAARGEIARANGESLDALRSEFTEAKAGDLWTALSGDPGKLGCDAKSCAADSYGRLWAAGVADAAALSRVGRIELRPGFTARAPADDELTTLQDLTALYPLVEDDERQTVLQDATDAAVSWARKSCGGASSKGHDKQLAKLQQLGTDAALRTDEARPMDTTMMWLTTQGIDAACSSTEVLAERASELAEQLGAASVPAELLALHVEKAPADKVAAVLETAARFAARYERGDRCADWTVALAAAFADAGDFERAQSWIQEATHCDVTERTAIDLVSAYLNFQRTSSTSADFAKVTRDRLREIAHVDVEQSQCVGIGGLEYRIVPALPESVRALAGRLSVAPGETGTELSLVTANDRLANAREHLANVGKLLDARDFGEAARTLGYAREAFETISHEVGIARTRWLDAVVFSGQASSIASGETKFEKVGFEPLRKKGTLTELAAGGNADAVMARALVTGDLATAKTAAAQPFGERPKLCEATPRRTRGVAIESVDGKLEAVGFPDEGPEIELVEPQVAPHK